MQNPLRSPRRRRRSKSKPPIASSADSNADDPADVVEKLQALQQRPGTRRTQASIRTLMSASRPQIAQPSVSSIVSACSDLPDDTNNVAVAEDKGWSSFNGFIETNGDGSEAEDETKNQAGLEAGTVAEEVGVGMDTGTEAEERIEIGMETGLEEEAGAEAEVAAKVLMETEVEAEVNGEIEGDDQAQIQAEIEVDAGIETEAAASGL